MSVTPAQKFLVYDPVDPYGSAASIITAVCKEAMKIHRQPGEGSVGEVEDKVLLETLVALRTSGDRHVARITPAPLYDTWQDAYAAVAAINDERHNDLQYAEGRRAR